MSKHKTEIVKAALTASAVCSALTSATLTFAMPGQSQLIPFLLSTIIPAAIAVPITYRSLVQKEKISSLTNQLAENSVALQNLVHLNEKRSTIDSMTGVFNRQHFLDSTAKNRKMEVSGGLIVLDVDGLKTINDLFGTVAGDSAISKLAYAISQAIRKGDILGRLGGEEFGVYLTEVTKEQAMIVAERIQNNVAAIRFNPDGTGLWPLSVSIGVTVDTHLEDFQKLISRAETALVDAKRAGKNHVSYSHPEARVAAA